MFLLKGGGWDGAIFHHRIIIDENVSRAFQWNSHHTKFISQRFNPFVPIFKDTNSAPKLEVSTVHCDLEYQTMGALFK